jgi:hypothetical protein
MWNQVICILLLIIFPCNLTAINLATQKKYPYSVLTDDYGILNEEDLDTLKFGVKPPTLLPKEGHSFLYWQCFPRDRISISLKDMGYTSEDIGGEENYSVLKIMISDESSGYHEYTMRRVWPTSTYEHRFNLWLKLMKNEKYVCLLGDFVNREEKIKGVVSQHWIFEKIKTKKGVTPILRVAAIS